MRASGSAARGLALALLATATLAAALLGAGREALAASRVVVLPGDDGDQILSVSEDETGNAANLTLICSSRSAQFGIVLMETAPGFPPDGAELTFRADGARVGPLRLSRQDKGLVLIGEGEGRDIVGKLVRAATIEVDENARTLRFVLGGAASEVARYREACQL